MKRWLLLSLIAGSGILSLLSATTLAQDKAQPAVTLNTEEQIILDLTNEAREKEKLPPLKPSPLLFQVAHAHSANMAKQQKLDHVLDEKGPFQRIKEAGYRYNIAGENVAYGNYAIKEIFEGWMKSEKHRENILDKRFTEIGLGNAVDPKGFGYYTQVFGNPKP